MFVCEREWDREFMCLERVYACWFSHWVYSPSRTFWFPLSSRTHPSGFPDCDKRAKVQLKNLVVVCTRQQECHFCSNTHIYRHTCKHTHTPQAVKCYTVHSGCSCHLNDSLPFPIMLCLPLLTLSFPSQCSAKPAIPFPFTSLWVCPQLLAKTGDRKNYWKNCQERWSICPDKPRSWSNLD